MRVLNAAARVRQAEDRGGIAAARQNQQRTDQSNPQSNEERSLIQRDRSAVPVLGTIVEGASARVFAHLSLMFPVWPRRKDDSTAPTRTFAE
jgi:hypothetical protein